MDPLALNVNPLANVADDTLCEYAIPCEEGLTGVKIVMNDSWGDGWNGNTFVMTATSGDEVYSGTVPVSSSTNTETVCVNPGCYSISVDGGTYQSEVSWEVFVTEGGEAVLEGGAPTSAFLSIGSDESCSEDNFLFGCMDPWASNYDQTATSDDGSCQYPFSVVCEQAQDIVFDTEFNSSSQANIWFTFSNDQDSMVLTSDINGGLYDFTQTVYSGDCDTLVLEEGVLPQGDLFVMISTSSPLNIFYSATFSLVPAVEGCMEEYANNYDETANVNAGCDYSCTGVPSVLKINGGSWVSEIYWEFVDSDALILASGGPYSTTNNFSLLDSIDLCLTSGGSYTFNAYDAFGDGWNSGGNYSITSDCDSLIFTQANNGGLSPNNTVTVEAGEYYLESSRNSQLFPVIL